jgi:hypothetical protein
MGRPFVLTIAAEEVERAPTRLPQLAQLIIEAGRVQMLWLGIDFEVVELVLRCLKLLKLF